MMQAHSPERVELAQPDSVRPNLARSVGGVHHQYLTEQAAEILLCSATGGQGRHPIPLPQLDVLHLSAIADVGIGSPAVRIAEFDSDVRWVIRAKLIHRPDCSESLTETAR